jgi:hypothetical protein
VQCKAYATTGSDYCFMHGGSVEAKAARLKGGLHRSPVARVSGDVPIVIASMEDVLKLINATIADSWQLENSPARSRVLLACASTAIEALQVGEFERRLQALESGAQHGEH